MDPVHLVDLVLLLMAAAVVLAVVARRLRTPPAVAFVIGGMVLAVMPGVPPFELNPALSMTLFLPPLLQASAFFTVWRDFRANLTPILLLAVGAVTFTTVAVGWTMKLLEPSLPWAACFTLGAIVSPPDAVAAGAVLKRLRIPRKLLSVLEGESLVNDASGLVLYRFALAVALGGTFDAGVAAASFVGVASAGIAIGIACGWLQVRIIGLLHDVKLEITASFLAAWASYIAAEAVGASGVLSTVACGLVLGWRQHEVLSPETRRDADAAWSFVIFVLESLVFVLIGLSLRGVVLRLDLPLAVTLAQGAAVTGAAILARFIWVFPVSFLSRVVSRLRGRDEPFSPRVMLVVSWAGMRGVVSLAAALALPDSFPARDQILLITFVVILGTVLIQGPTLGPLIQRLNIARDDPTLDGDHDAARNAIAAAALRFIEARATDPLDGAMAADLVAEFRDLADRGTNAPTTAAARAGRSARREIRLGAVAAGRAELLRLHRVGEIHDTVLVTLEHELDLQEIRLRRRGETG